MIKWSILQRDVTILNVYAPNKTAFKCSAWDKIDRITRRNTWIHYYGWRNQHLSIGNGQTQRTENQQGHSWSQADCQAIGYNRQVKTTVGTAGHTYAEKSI